MSTMMNDTMYVRILEESEIFLNMWKLQSFYIYRISSFEVAEIASFTRAGSVAILQDLTESMLLTLHPLTGVYYHHRQRFRHV